MDHHGLTSESDEASSAGRRRYSQTLYNYHNCLIDNSNRLTRLKSRKYINKMVNKKKKFDRKTIFPFFFLSNILKMADRPAAGRIMDETVSVREEKVNARATTDGHSCYRGMSAGITENVNTVAASSAAKNGG